MYSSKNLSVVTKFIVIMLVLMALSSIRAQANIINRIDMKVKVNNDGSANIEEIWTANVDSGSEFNKPFKHLNYCKIRDFTVKDEAGNEYTKNRYWDSNESRLDKFTKNGMRERMSGEVRLYWGLGNYGDRAYVLNYTVDNFVTNGADSQLTYFTFIDPEKAAPIDKVSIEIDFSNTDANFDNIEYVTYGLNTEEAINNKVLKIESKGKQIGSDDYFVLLMAYGNDVFSCSERMNRTYESIRNECDERSGIGINIKNLSITAIGIIALIILAIAGVVYYIVSEIKIRKRAKNKEGISIRILDNKFDRGEKGTYEVTGQAHEIFELYTIGYGYKMTSHPYNIISALIMKWILNGNLMIEYTGKDFDFQIYRIDDLEESDSLENKLYSILFLSNEDDNKPITIATIDQTIRKNMSSIRNTLNDILTSVSRSYVDRGMLKVVEMSKRMKKHMTFTEYKCTKEMNKLASRVLKFREEIIKSKGAIGNTELVYMQLLGATNNLSIEKTDLQKLIIAVNKINQVVVVDIVSNVRANKKTEIDNLINKVYEKLGLLDE